ncbi:MAG: GAF domain-containing protein [Candidatus Eisenbacteria bacterium]|nr:GAF domain-containing protein [Candidatus Eisenbacteria bacterium]
MERNKNGPSGANRAPFPDPFWEEQLRYLLAFSGGLLDLIPDGVAVLDDGLRVRSANRCFREAFAAAAAEDGPPAPFDHPLLDAPVRPTGGAPSLRDELLGLLRDGGGERPRRFTLSLQSPEGERRWVVEARAWDRDDPEGRRLLLWIREEGRAEEPHTAVLVGASEEDLALIDLLHRSTGVRLLRVWDPDPDAPGLSFATERGIAASGGGEPAPQGARAPEAFLIARAELRAGLRGRPPAGAVIVQPEEIDAFLRDPDLYLRGRRKRGRAEAGGDEAAFGERAAGETRPQDGERNSGEETVKNPAASGIDGEVDRILQALDLILDFQSLSDWVLERALDLSGGVTGSLMILEGERELRIVASRGIPENVARSTRLRVGEGIAGSVAQKGEPLLLVGRVGDERFQGVGGRPKIGSSISVPIRAGDMLLGVLNVNAPPEERTFGERELEQVGRLGLQIGRALQRSLELREMQRRSYEQSIRSQVDSIAAGAADLGTKLRRIAARLAGVLEADLCSIFLLDPEQEELELRASAGPAAGAIATARIRVGRGLVGRVARNRSPIRMRSEPNGETAVLLEMGVPILHHTDLFGVLLLETGFPAGAEEERSESIASALAAGASRIGEVCGYDRSNRRMTFLSALSEMGTAFTAARDRTGLAKLIAFTAATVLESEVAMVRILREGADPAAAGSEEMELLAAHGASLPGEDHPLALLDELVSAKATTSGRATRETGGDPGAEASLRKRANVSAFLGLPVLSGRDRIGTITVYRVIGPEERETRYGEQEMEAGMRLADYAAAAAIRFTGTEDEEK